jgi:energy-converting hydrogenase A subunit R
MANVRCTKLSLDAWSMPEDERAWLRREAAGVMERGLIEIPDGAGSAGDLSPRDAVTVAGLDDLFWGQMRGRVSGALVAAVRPVGGGMKLAALEEIVAAEGVEGAGVMYVGDSITDTPPLAAVKAWGGVSLSFNGNRYALAAAEFAAASPDAGVAAELANAFAGNGRGGVEAAVRVWPRPKGDEKPTGAALARVGLVAEEPDALAEASAAARRSVRGERIASLG